MGRGVFDLRKNYAFYGAYHSDSINKFIHICFVWPIFFATCLLLLLIKPLSPWPNIALPWGGHLQLTVALLGAILYAGFYLLLEPKAGSVAAPLVFGSFFGAHAVIQTFGPSFALKLALVMEVVCWSAQIFGHQVFEKRAPALLDNLVQAFLMAPFFVLLEILHGLFKYEPEPGFWSSVEADIATDIAAFRAKSKVA